MKNYSTSHIQEETNIIEKVSLADCEIIAQWIHEENEINGHHMLESTAQELFHQANTHGCCGIKELHKLIGFIKLMPVQKDGLTLFERGSLFIHPDYRHQGRGKHLVKTILENNPNTPVYSVTNVAAVKNINTSLGQHEYTANTIPKQIIEVIETAGKLLPNDVIYANEILHTLIQTSGQKI